MKASNRPRVSRRLICAQALLGIGAWVLFVLPYLRRTHGMERLHPTQRYLFIANHVSLLDTILLGGLCWRSGCYPILTLGDKAVWQASWVKTLLSKWIGFLLERGKLSPGRIEDLQNFGRAASEFNLLVFPEGTRGDGIRVAPCQPGLYFIALEAGVPMVPVFIENMQFVSTKTGRFHPAAGWRRIEVHFGEPIAPESYLPLSRDDFGEFARQKIAAAKSGKPVDQPNIASSQA